MFPHNWYLRTLKNRRGSLVQFCSVMHDMQSLSGEAEEVCNSLQDYVLDDYSIESSFSDLECLDMYCKIATPTAGKPIKCSIKGADVPLMLCMRIFKCSHFLTAQV